MANINDPAIPDLAVSDSQRHASKDELAIVGLNMMHSSCAPAAPGDNIYDAVMPVPVANDSKRQESVDAWGQHGRAMWTACQTHGRHRMIKTRARQTRGRLLARTWQRHGMAWQGMVDALHAQANAWQPQAWRAMSLLHGGRKAMAW